MRQFGYDDNLRSACDGAASLALFVGVVCGGFPDSRATVRLHFRDSRRNVNVDQHCVPFLKHEHLWAVTCEPNIRIRVD